MAIITTNDEHYKEIANAIRARGYVSTLYKPSEMSEGVLEVARVQHAAGRNLGYTEGEHQGIIEGKEQGIAEGIEQGKQAEYDAFWDAFQKNGTEPMYYGYVFANRDLWTQENIEKVKYKHLLANYFSVVFNGNTSITDLSAFSFEYAGSLLTLSSTFSGCTNLKKCMPINCDMVYAFTNAFNNCTALEELTLSGTYNSRTKDPLDLHWSTKLNKASITSVINALSTTTSGLSVTFSQTAVNNAFTSDEWSALIATKQNWTISLV